MYSNLSVTYPSTTILVRKSMVVVASYHNQYSEADREQCCTNAKESVGLRRSVSNLPDATGLNWVMHRSLSTPGVGLRNDL